MLEVVKENITAIMAVVAFALGSVCLYYYRDLFMIRSLKQASKWSLGFSVCNLLSMLVFSYIERALIGVTAAGAFGCFFMGALVMLGCTAFLKKETVAVMDMFAVHTMIVLITQRISCCVIGCCGGVQMINDYLWPVREIELVLNIGMVIVLLRWMIKDDYRRGNAYPVMMIGYGSYRFLIEWFRYARLLRFGLHMAHIWSVITVIIGLSIYLEFAARTSDTTDKA